MNKLIALIIALFYNTVTRNQSKRKKKTLIFTKIKLKENIIYISPLLNNEKLILVTMKYVA